MSTPLFIRQPVVGFDSYVASDLSSGMPTTFRQFSTGGALADGTGFTVVDEPTLVEEIIYSTEVLYNDQGRLVIAMVYSAHNNTDINSSPKILGDFIIAAGTTTSRGCGRIALNVVLPQNFSLGWAADVKTNGAGAYTVLHVTAQGGILR